MKKQLIEARLDLGIRKLLPEWKVLLSPRYLKEDIIAGLTVACIAVPLSLAIALASSVPPALGLVTAIVAGVVCALFGGTQLAVSGPAAAMAVLIASTVQTYGMGGLLVIGLLCGLLQLLTGTLGLGKIIRLVPLPVVEGFTAGIGAIILIGQLPRVLGLPPPDQSHVVDVFVHIRDLLHEAQPASVLLALGTLALVFGLPRLSPRIPAPLLGVAIPAAIAFVFRVDTETLGSIPNTLPSPKLPSFPEDTKWGSLLGTSLVVYALASLESLLSSSAIDKIAHGKRHDPDQELIGQGLGNVASAVMGGIPVTSVIARSALNVQAGGKTRRAAIFHTLVLLAVVYWMAPLVARIPVAALAGVLFSVAFRMLALKKLRSLLYFSRSDALVYLTTFVVIVFTDLIEGVQWGIVAALVVAAIRLSQTYAHLQPVDGGSPSRLVLKGPITFLASLKVEKMRSQIAKATPGASIVFDLSGATSIDASGAEMVVDLVRAMRERDLRIAVLGLKPDLARSVLASDHAGVIAGSMAQTEQDTARILSTPMPLSTRQRLLLGVEHYRKEHLPRYTGLFQRLSQKQAPHTLFITCSDSRIQPALLTSADPGELFIVRNVGNMVPRFSATNPPAAGAPVEYAVHFLGVRAIVLCSHSSCGAIQALRRPHEVPAECQSLNAWLNVTEARDLCQRLPDAVPDDEVARINALLQIDHLATYPLVREKIASGELLIYAWFFDVASGEILEWDAQNQQWRKLTVAAPTQDTTTQPTPLTPSTPETSVRLDLQPAGGRP